MNDISADPASATHAFHALDPGAMLDAIESTGRRCTGAVLELNSYENRVYRIGLEDAAPVVAKFYRPARWSDEAILEEHDFTLELAALDIPVVPPLADAGVSLHHAGPFRFALYPLKGGRAPDLENAEQLTQFGRFLGRIHACGAQRDFAYRPTLSVEHFGDDSYAYLLDHGFLPPELAANYEKLAEDVLDAVEDRMAEAGDVEILRLHGDCHPGNILWTDAGPHIVDFDDARMGPAMQDLWMFVTGERADMELHLGELLTGYTHFFDFDTRELALIEPLRTLRIMHYAAWLGRRWDDPAFRRAFPWFNTQHYWQEHILALKEQAALLNEAPLEWIP
jgi:Ser/Thr protein kinase RdoA (MazF antagonist)